MSIGVAVILSLAVYGAFRGAMDLLDLSDGERSESTSARGKQAAAKSAPDAQAPEPPKPQPQRNQQGRG